MDEKSEGAVVLADRNRRLELLVAELLNKNEVLRRELAASRGAGPADEPRSMSL